MKSKKMCTGVYWVGAVDWNRRLFESLTPLPDGTSYNAYLVQGSEKTVLIDSIDPKMAETLKNHLSEVEKIDYIICQHVEQDHSGSIPMVLEMYPDSIVLCSSKAKNMIIDHLEISEEKIKVVNDGEILSLGDKSLQFIYTPWVHWPETMVTYLKEDRILFTCDFFGSHVATSELYAGNDPFVMDAAKRYYAEIMMPFRKVIQKNLKKLESIEFDMIAPSHGPIFDNPELIVSAYREWISDKVSNLVVIPYVTMHENTEIMVDYLVSALVERGVAVQKFELSTTDIGKLAMALVDAATIVIGTPTVIGGPHPSAFSAAFLTNALQPKLKYAAVIGSYGWGTRAVEQILGVIPNLKVEVLGSVLCKGKPKDDTYAALDLLADNIQSKHAVAAETICA
jgi:flavorubredoxin